MKHQAAGLALLLLVSCADARLPVGVGACHYRASFTQAERVDVELVCEGPELTGLAVNLPAVTPHTRVWQGGEELSAGSDDRFSLARPGRTVRLRYQVELGALARRYDDFDVAKSQGGALIAPAYSWLLTPSPLPAGLPVRVEVQVPQGAEFASGLASAGRGYELLAQELPVATYSAFGRLNRRTLKLPGREGEAALEVVSLPEPSPVTRAPVVKTADEEGSAPDDAASAPEAVATAGAEERPRVAGSSGGQLTNAQRTARVAWVDGAAQAVARFWGGFPVPRATLFVVSVAARRRALFGKLLPASGPGVVLLLGADSEADDLANDWILVHELFHLGVPSFSGEGRWLDEGLATYFEPLIRARSLGLSEQEAWSELAQGFERGTQALASTGLERTQDYGAVYWGGALVCLLADMEIRRGSQGRLGLEDGLREVLRQGGHAREVWRVSEVARVVDEATGAQVLSELVARYGVRAAPVDLTAILGIIGVRRGASGITLDTSGEAAWLRRALTYGEAAGPPVDALAP